MSNILILGATGTVGAYSALYLKERGYNVIACGRRKSDNGFFADYDIPYYSIDVKNSEDFAVLLGKNISAIIHCAGAMPAAMPDFDPFDFVDSIVKGTLNVLEFARAAGVEKIIFTHSRADSNYLMGTAKKIPADIEKKFPQKGDHSIYAICKNTAVDFVEHYYHEYGIKRFVFRLPTIYAYHPNRYFYVNGVKKTKAYRYIMDRAIKGEPIEVWGDPTRQKEITYVGDLCQCFEKALLSPLDGGVYNIGRGVGITLEEQIKGIVDVFCGEAKSALNYMPEKPDARQFIHDISKTRDELGYVPEYDYIRLLKDFKREMESGRFKKLWGSEEDYE